MKLKTYLYNLAVMLDQAVNTILCGFPDETISARAYRRASDGIRWGIVARKVIDTIFFFDPNHCYESYKSEHHRRQMPPEYREKLK